MSEHQPSKFELRQFSKEYSPEQRQQLVQEIKADRKKYFGEKARIEELLANLEQQIEDKRLGLREAGSKIEGIHNRLLELKNGWVNKLIGYRERRALENNLGVKQEAIRQAEKDLAVMSQIFSETQQTEITQNNLGELKARISDFYKGQENELQEYEEGEKARDVKNVMGRYNAYFVHAVHPEVVPADNSSLFRTTNWETKMKIFLGLEPTVSASTVKAGDDFRNMYARMGFVLKGGRVEDASVRDAATKMSGLKNRYTAKIDLDKKDILQKIDEAVTAEKQGYNELVVSKPEVGGLYICQDETPGLIKFDTVPDEELVKFGRKMGLPVYALKKGELFETSYNEQRKKLESGNLVKPLEFLEKPVGLQEERKQECRQEICEDSPFHIKSPEAQYFQSRCTGQETYLLLLGEDKLKSLPAKKDRLYEFDDRGNRRESEKEYNILKETKGIGETIKYFEEEGKIMIFGDYQNAEFHQHRTGVGYYKDKRGNFDSGYVEIGYVNVKAENPVKNFYDCLQAIGKHIEWCKTGWEKANKKQSNYARQYQEWINQAACHLYGMAEQARQLGEEEEALKAEDMASKYFTQEQYRNFLTRRLGKDGGFKITQADLE